MSWLEANLAMDLIFSIFYKFSNGYGGEGRLGGRVEGGELWLGCIVWENLFSIKI